MKTNHYFSIGKDHDICEDYSLSGVNNNVGYAIVCDGCSASPDVDFGARALALSARETILETTDAIHSDYKEFGTWTIYKAQKARDVFPHLHNQCLDVTLLVSWVKDGILTCYMYGDGVFIHKSKETVRLVHIDFLSGAPAYLSYNLDEYRMSLYNKEADMSKHVIDTIDGSFDPKSLKPFDPVVITTPVLEGDVISVCSDGINSFRKANNDVIPWTDLVNEFTGYKNMNGEFVKRRMNAFKRSCAKELTTHFDDISVATIVV